MVKLNIKVNGKKHAISEDPEKPLLWVLRDNLKLNGTKFGCGIGLCGACSVEIDGDIVRSCVTPFDAVDGAKITTIEGISENGKLHHVQEAWIAEQVPQCGYCQSGMIMAVVNLLRNNSNPSIEDIKSSITNICRCGTYPRILKAILRAAELMRAQNK